MRYQFEWHLVTRQWPAVLEGIGTTYEVAVLALLVALILGLALALMGASSIRPVAHAARAYIELFRALPLYAMLVWLYYGLSVAADVSLSAVTAGVAALGLVTAAYMAEIYRGGLAAVDRGQFEAARALGLSTVSIHRDVVLPQAVRVILPAAGNQFVGILKGAAIVSIIGAPDLMFWANQESLKHFRPFEFYTAAAVLLIGSTLCVAALVGVLERRMKGKRGLA
jgi:His/Glu/Gln/Arg/opine family amino acid ABC transporter permease subunit